ncbi:hypothetical protein NQ314_020308 [Rhamnusium bicolor]|uniref:Uncharacterized protein n=1 Tax=Rhamnusium bicolor TaxID=1586634 RepID=A0AAV8WKZ2_9CUCU|nr:hypothetical protein NQ314_020308 [Rhamnusium bicolor]
MNIKEFLFEMSDDPFEVKLRDNFELLEDEYNESLKRQKMLKDKVQIHTFPWPTHNFNFRLQIYLKHIFTCLLEK